MIKKCSRYFFVNRTLDLLIACTALIVVIPVFIPVMIILRFTGEGEIFYSQKRIGYQNNEFKIWKFATMLKDSLNMGTGSITLENDFRVTTFGRLLRKTKINELPQLYNIILGEITLVGPRPVLEQDWLLYSEEIRNRIYLVKPGLTGIGSIVFRDEEAIITSADGSDYHKFYKNVIAPYKGELEIWYQENRSTYLDLKLMFLTAVVIMFPKNKTYEKWFNDLPERSF